MQRLVVVRDRCCKYRTNQGDSHYTANQEVKKSLMSYAMCFIVSVGNIVITISPAFRVTILGRMYHHLSIFSDLYRKQD